MAQKLRTLLTAVNTWLVLAGAALAIAVDELTPLAELHPAIEWAVRVAGAALVVLGTASRILARSTEVPAGLRGLNPDVAFSASWPAWNGGRYRYTPPPGRTERRDPTGARIHPSQPPPDPAA